MTISEFSDQMDVLYNNITSNQAPGLNEYEKSLFLTKAEKEIVKNYFNPNSQGNTVKQGFDDSAKRQADFSVLMRTASCALASVGGEITTTVKKFTCTSNDGKTLILRGRDVMFIKDNVFIDLGVGEYAVENNIIYLGDDPVTVDGFPFTDGTIEIGEEHLTYNISKIDNRSTVYSFPTDTFIVVNESIITDGGKYLQVIPLRYDEYTRLMLKPFKYPLKNQAWRLINSGSVQTGKATKFVEIITNLHDEIATYNIRYVRTPKPIIVAALGNLTIDGQSAPSLECELDPILHEDVLQRAVELAKIAWTQTGQDNANLVLQAGQRSE